MLPPDRFPRLLALGDTAWTLELGHTLDEAVSARVLGLYERVREADWQAHWPGVVEWVPTLRSLTVHFDPLTTDADALGQALLQAASLSHVHSPKGRHWRLPLCVEDAWALDLVRVAQDAGLSLTEVRDQLLSSCLRVGMLGFLPGFAYMTGVPQPLQQPRLATPRTGVPAGSVAVAGGMCAIYPCASPGGWRLLGRMPLPLFDPQRSDQPALLAPGDTVRWRRVSQAECDELARCCASGAFNPTDWLDTGAAA